MILVDTSGLVAAIDPRQAYHAAALEVLARSQPRLLSPFILAELDYLIATRTGQTEALKLLTDLARGTYQLEPFGAADIAACITVIRRHAALDIGLADASIVVLAERHQCLDLLTLDQRHFRTVLGPNQRPFRLLPFDDA
jgi:predicted nucleic acid-binding protein